MVNATGPSYKFASILFDFKTAIKSSCILVSRTTAYGSSFQFFEYLFIYHFIQYKPRSRQRSGKYVVI